MEGNAKQFVDYMRSLLLTKESLSYNERQEFLIKQPIPFPNFFYHYRGTSGANDARNLHDFLVNSRLFLRRPRDFNDPFECRFQFGQLGTITELYDRFTESAAAQGLSRHVIQSAVPELLLGTNHSSIRETAMKETLSRFQAIGIFCFCESYKDILMWGHYGESHRGVCIEFDCAEGLRTFGLCLKVRYDNAMPVLDYPEKSPKDLFNPIVRKAEQWRYEREWRIAIPSGAHQYLDFPSSSVKTIIYGCETNDNTRKLIRKLLDERRKHGHPPINERTLSRSDNKYELVDST